MSLELPALDDIAKPASQNGGPAAPPVESPAIGLPFWHRPLASGAATDAASLEPANRGEAAPAPAPAPPTGVGGGSHGNGNGDGGEGISLAGRDGGDGGAPATGGGDGAVQAAAGDAAGSAMEGMEGAGAAAGEGEGELEGRAGGAAAKKKRKRKPRELFMDMEENQVRGRGMRPVRQHARPQTYDEAALDSMIDEQIGDIAGPGRRKKKQVDTAKENNMEAMIGAAIGFSREFLSDEEVAAEVLPSDTSAQERANYIMVRNHILTRWRENVSVWLSQDTVMETIQTKFRGLVSVAYKFLMQYGYINFGVAAAIKANIPKEPTKGTVVIIGSGFAGLAAARQLLAFGHRVVILEGRQRPGGRVYTKRMEGVTLAGTVVAAADMGGSVVTGVHGNPLAVLARQLGYPLHKIREPCPLFKPDGSPVSQVLDKKMEKHFNDILDEVSLYRQQVENAEGLSLGGALDVLRAKLGVVETEEERQLFDWHVANLEYANAELLSKLSLSHWDQDDPYEMGGDHCWLAGGNVRLIAALAENIPIFYGSTVHSITYSDTGVQVETGDQVFVADMALCTVPLGVLKRGCIKFHPELPQRKLDAIRRLGFGLLNKVVMLFPATFWGAELDHFGHLTDDRSTNGEFFMFYSYAAVAGGPLLLALVAGQSAINFEDMAPVEAVTRVLKVLRGIYKLRGVVVPDPLQSVCTRWGNDSLCYGSYSNVAVGSSGEDYDILAESVGDGRLFFAGEATNRRYPATMHGAFLSGLREAGNIAVRAAARLASTAKLSRGIQKDLTACPTFMEDIFNEPDLNFGCFDVIFDPRTMDPMSSVLLRVVLVDSTRRPSGFIGEGQNGEPLKEPLKLYSVISRLQALQLMEAGEGDEMKLRFLIGSLRARLVGRRGLGAHGDALALAAKWARTGTRRDAARTVKSGSAGNRQAPSPHGGRLPPS